ncbi:MAG: HAD-IC family P-type ATPase [Desulfobacterales bacterium]|nr:HAD-IC family P-type ATPase [Desulfobacterales bacterium]
MKNADPHPLPSEFLVQTVHSRVPGRGRFRIYGLKAAPFLKPQIEEALSRQKEISQVSVSVSTGKALVCFDENIPHETIAERLFHILHPNASNIPFSANLSPDSPAAGETNPIDPQTFAAMEDWHRRSISRTMEILGAEASAGLSEDAAAGKLKLYGRNILPQRRERTGFSIFADQFKSLPVGLLGAAAGLSLALGAIVDAAVIVGVLGVNSVIGFATERQSEKTIQTLQKIVPPPVRVIRKNKAVKIASETAVPGDILVLKPGTYIAADARIVEATSLTIDESSITGESLPVEKFTKALKKKDLPISERKNMAFMGSVVTGGWGKAVVVATGPNTAFGQYQALLQDTTPPKPPIETKLDRTGNQLVMLWGGVCAGVFGVGLLRGFNILNLLRVSVSLAAAAVPEGLPAAATTTFALGMNKMREYGILIRHLPAVETLGAVQTICLDKTGTITRNRMTLAEVYTGKKRLDLDNGRLQLAGEAVASGKIPELDQLLTVGFLCSQVKINGNNENCDPELIGSPTENALVHAALRHHMDVKSIRKQHKLLEVNHRSEKHPIMSTIHTAPADKFLHAVKGSPADVLGMCGFHMVDGEIRPLTAEDRKSIKAENKRMAGKAYRILGAAFRTVENLKQTRSPNGYVWLGLIALRDPLRQNVKAAIHAFHQAGIQTVMITGDQPLTAEAVARELDLSNGRPLKLMDVEELAGVTPDELKERAAEVHVYARVSPAHKLKIVQAIQASGKVVAMTGDGINDAPALKAADVGIAMGRDGTDVARDVADVVLAKDHLDTIIQSVRHGRTTYANIKKSVHFFLSTNFTEIMLVAASMGVGLGSPLTAMQLLWINIISDIFPGLALSLEPPDTDVLEHPPRPYDEPIFNRSDYGTMMRESGVITGTAMGAYGYGLLTYGFGAQASALAFHSLTLGQLLHAFSCRTENQTVLSSYRRPGNNWLNLAVFGSIGLHLSTMFVPGLRNFLQLAPLRPVDTAIVFGAALLSLTGNETIKSLLHSKTPAQIARKRLLSNFTV